MVMFCLFIPCWPAWTRGWQNGRVRVDRTVLFRMATNERLEMVVMAAPGGEAAAWRATSLVALALKR